MRVIEINDVLYKIIDRDYTFIKEEVEKYLQREVIVASVQNKKKW